MNNEHDVPEQPAGPPTESQQPEPHAHDAGSGEPQPEPQTLGGQQLPYQAQGPATAAAPPTAHQESAKFFQWIRGLGLQRGRDRWMGGVCSGLADRWGIDPVIVRGLAVVLTLFFGIGMLAYGVAWALLPEPDGRIHVEEVARGRWTSGMTGAGLLTLLGLAGQGQGIFFDGNNGWFFWPLFWIAAVAGLIYWLANRDKPKGSGTQPGRQGHPGTTGQTGNTGGAGTPAPSWHGHTWESGAYGGYGAADAPAGYGTTDTPGAGAAAGAPTAPLPAPAMAAAGQTPHVQQPFAPNPHMYVKTAPRPPKPRLGAPASLLVLGLAAVVGALVLILDATNIIDLGGYQAGMAAAAAAITTGLGIIAAGLAGRTAGGLGTFSVIFLIFAGLLSLPYGNHAEFTAFNHTDWAPATSTAAETGRTVVMGNATFDLTQLDDAAPLAADVQIPLKSVASNITVKVPTDIPVTVRSEFVAVSLSIDGKNDGGVLTQDSTRDINPDATGNGLVITLEGVASNINIVPVAGP